MVFIHPSPHSIASCFHSSETIRLIVHYPKIPVTAQAAATKGKSDQATNKLEKNSTKKKKLTYFLLETLYTSISQV